MTAIDLGNETENSIFEAALDVFSRKGKDGARMQEIADAAGINKAMLHYYFRSKDLLYESVFGHVARHFFSALEAVMTAKSRRDITEACGPAEGRRRPPRS